MCVDIRIVENIILFMGREKRAAKGGRVRKSQSNASASSGNVAVIDNAAGLSSAAMEMMNKRTELSTKDNYKGKLNSFYKWLQAKSPELWDDSSGVVRWSMLNAAVIPNFLSEEMWNKNGTAKSQSTMGNYRSAISNSYKDALRCTFLPSDIDKSVSDFFAGYKRNCSKMKEKGLMKMDEGKRGFTMSGYRLTVMYALKTITNSKTLLIVWFHLVYTWNLAARLASAVNLRTNLFGKSIDCFYVQFANHKGDEDGDNSWPKHKGDHCATQSQQIPLCSCSASHGSDLKEVLTLLANNISNIANISNSNSISNGSAAIFTVYN